MKINGFAFLFQKQIKELVKYYVENFGFLEWWIGIRQVNGTWQWVDGEEEYAKIP
jgi:hypothetical protein